MLRSSSFFFFSFLFTLHRIPLSIPVADERAARGEMPSLFAASSGKVFLFRLLVKFLHTRPKSRTIHFSPFHDGSAQKFRVRNASRRSPVARIP